jgi:hypothetical protein
MDGGGVLYHTKNPFEIARLMDGILDSPDIEDAIVASQDAALARLLRKDFGGTLLRFVDQIRATPPRPAPEVPYDFWPMFDQAERLEELRQFRPAIYRALPPEPRIEDRGPGIGNTQTSTSRSSVSEPRTATREPR